MVKIGEYGLHQQFSLLIPHGVSTHIPVRIDDRTINIEIKFNNESSEMSIDISRNELDIKITFNKWNDGLGTALKGPISLLDLGKGQRLAFMASNYAIGTTNQLDLQLLVQ